MDKDGYWTTFYHLAVALGYNTEKVKKDQAPKNYDDLLNPKWKGRMSLDQTDMHLFGTLIEHWGREKGLNYFRRLAENDPSMPPRQNIAGADYRCRRSPHRSVAFGYRPLAMKREGAPVDISLLTPLLSVPTYLLLAKNA